MTLCLNWDANDCLMVIYNFNSCFSYEVSGPNWLLHSQKLCVRDGGYWFHFMTESNASFLIPKPMRKSHPICVFKVWCPQTFMPRNRSSSPEVITCYVPSAVVYLQWKCQRNKMVWTPEPLDLAPEAAPDQQLVSKDMPGLAIRPQSVYIRVQFCWQDITAHSWADTDFNSSSQKKTLQVHAQIAHTLNDDRITGAALSVIALEVSVFLSPQKFGDVRNKKRLEILSSLCIDTTS